MSAEIVSPTSVRASQLDEIPSFHQPRSFRPLMSDVTAPHQINLTWTSDAMVEQVALCNCGWSGSAYRPEVLGSTSAMVAEYEAHLVAVGYIEPGQLRLL